MGLWDYGTMGLWDYGTMGLWDYGTDFFRRLTEYKLNVQVNCSGTLKTLRLFFYVFFKRLIFIHISAILPFIDTTQQTHGIAQNP